MARSGTGSTATQNAPMKLRILICAYACMSDVGSTRPGGGDLMAWNMIRALSRVHRLWVLTAAQNRPAIEAALRTEPLPQVTFVYVSLPRVLDPLLKSQGALQFYAYLWQWKAYFVAKKLHRQVHFELFHHLTYENDWMASIIGALLPVPYVRGPGGGAHRIPPAFLEEFSTGERVADWRREYGQWGFRHDPFFLLSHSRARAILVCNQEAWEAMPARWKHKTQLMTVNGVAKEFLRDSSAPETQGHRFEILSAGRLIRLKGFDLAIRGFKLFSAQVPDSQLTIVGDGPDLSRLQGLVSQLGLEGRVRFETWMPREDLLGKMRSCDVFLFTSLRDGGGLVVVEAMASGKPVVCLDLAGPAFHITEECGIKLPARSPGEVIELMPQALERLYRDRELRVKMGQAGRARAEKGYTWDYLGERILKLYEEVLGANSHGAS